MNHQANLRTEITAGITTFLTMSYVLLVVPSMLTKTGMPHDAVFTATCLTTIIGCLLIGLLANYPIAIAPGLGLVGYFSYVVVLQMHFSWQTALGAVFIAGIVFFLLTVLHIRRWIIEAIPKSLSIGTAAGIGLFIGIIALKNAHIIVGNPASLLQLGHLSSAPALLALLGFILVVILEYYRFPAAIISVILLLSIIAILLGKAHFHGIFALPPLPKETFFALNFHDLLNIHGLIVIFTFLIVAFFDSTGTLIGVLHHTSLLQRQDAKKHLSCALTADSLATIVAGLLGTTTTATYVESTAGIRAGGRTGLTAVTVGILFIFALFLSPLTKMIPDFASSPALLYIACMMLKTMKDIPRKDITEFIPAAITMIMIPLSFSISNGIGLGFISYVFIKLCCGKARQIKPMLYILAIVFIIYFISTSLHLTY